MFTIGIFTTHLPYIAFVVFYAFFLLFGVNKASSGEIQWGESNIVLKAPAEEIAKVNFADFSKSPAAVKTVPAEGDFYHAGRRLANRSFSLRLGRAGRISCSATTAERATLKHRA